MANERDSAVRFVAAVLDQLSTIAWVRYFVVFDRASTDGTRELVEDLAIGDKRIVSIYASESRGVVDAYMRGYAEALKSPAEWILEIDAGFSHQPEDIQAFLNEAETGTECVFGTRFAKGGRMEDAPISRRILSRGGTLLSNAMLGTGLSDMTSGFQLFRRDAAEAILANGIESRGPFFQTEMKVHARRMTFAEVPIQYRTPTHNMSGDSVRDALTNLRVLRRRIRLEARRA